MRTTSYGYISDCASVLSSASLNVMIRYVGIEGSTVFRSSGSIVVQLATMLLLYV